MRFFLLRVRLLYYLLSFLLELNWQYVIHIQAGLWSLALVAVVLLGMFVNYETIKIQVNAEQITTVQATKKIVHQDVTFTREELLNAKKTYLQILAVQPQHRDILVNLTYMEKALRNQKDAYHYWQEAEKLDPNNPIFQN